MTISNHTDAAAIDVLAAAAIQLFDREQGEPVRTVLPSVGHHLNDLASALNYADSKHERNYLIFLYSQAAALAGWLELEQEGQGIHRYWSAALAAAGEIKSESLLACVQTYMSYAAAAQDAPTTALHLAHTAFSHAGDDQRARAWTAARIAQEAAGLGDQAAAFKHLDVVLECNLELKPLAPDDMSSLWARFVDSAYLYGMIADVFGRMKITSDAYIAALWARDTLTEQPTKARALTLAEIAYAFAAVWQLDEAVWYGTQAVELAELLEARQIKRRLRALIPLLPTPLSGTAAALVERVARS